jgi:SUKH-4 immunity protein
MTEAEAVLEQFGADGVRRISDPAFLARIGHEPSRVVLEQVGLPRAAMKIFTLAEVFADGMRTWAEQAAADPDRIRSDQVDGSGDWFLLGRLLYSAVALDPATGVVYLLPEVGGAPERLNQSLDAFVGFLCAFDRATAACVQEEKSRTPGVDYIDFCAGVGEELEGRLLALDAEALADPEGIWGNTLFEISEAMW